MRKWYSLHTMPYCPCSICMLCEWLIFCKNCFVTGFAGLNKEILTLSNSNLRLFCDVLRHIASVYAFEAFLNHEVPSREPSQVVSSVNKHALLQEIILKPEEMPTWNKSVSDVKVWK